MEIQMKLQATPNLFRAVAECTQPYGPPASGSSIRLLQSYLANERCVDSVYKAILARAVSEPQSEAVITRCIALVKQYISRYPPSGPVLQAIAVACQRLAASFPPGSGLQKSLVYLESSVARTADTTATNRRLAQLQPRSTNNTSPRPWLHAAVNGDSGRGKAVGGSFSARSHTSTDDVQPTAAAGSPTRVSLDQQRQQQQGYAAVSLASVQPLQIHDEDAATADAEELDQWQMPLQHADKAVNQQGGTPGWSFQPSALQELWCHQPDAELGELDWSLLLPHYSPSLVPLVEGLPGMEVLQMLTCQDIMSAVTESDPGTLVRQMREVTEVRRMQAGVSPELLQQALQKSSTSRARRLFQPLAYTKQEPIDLASTDVAAIVEIMCGKPSPAAPSAITGAVGLEDPSIYWQQRLGQLQQQQQQQLLMLYQQADQQQQLHCESIGQISSCILVKLVVDLWLAAGGVAAFPLVLRMLQQALYQSQAEYRSSTFDIIYNLSLHGALLTPADFSAPGPHAAQQTRAPQGEQAAGQHLCLLEQQQRQQYQQQLQQLAALQRLQPAQLRYDSPAAAGAAAVHERGSPGNASSADVGDTDSQDSSGSHREARSSRSNQSSPRIHLPPQLLAPQQTAAARHQQQQPGAPGQQVNSSPVPSPKGRSRLSRSEMRATAEQQEQCRSSSSFKGSLGGATMGEGGEAEAAVGVTGTGGGRLGVDVEAAGKHAGLQTASIEHQLPVEVAWEVWLQQLLYELLFMLAMLEEPSEQVWQSAVGCLLHLTTHAGHWVASSLHLLPPAAAAALLNVSVKFSWSQELHARLVQMAVNLLYITDTAPSSADCADAEAVDSGAACGGRTQQVGKVRSPGRWRQQFRQDQATEQQQQQQYQNQQQAEENLSLPGPADEAKQTFDSEALSRSSDSHIQTGEEGQQEPELDLPCQLHAGPVDQGQFIAFGGVQQLLRHFCYAASVEAQRTLLVPLLQALMPDDAPDASQLAVLQALCSSPNCLAALQVTLSAGLPGWADPILSAITQLLGDQELDLQLLATLLLRLENLSIEQQHVACLGSADQHSPSDGSDSDMAAGMEGMAGHPEAQQQQQPPIDGCIGAGGLENVATGLNTFMPSEVETAMQVTLLQLAGQLPAQPQTRPGPQGTDVVVYQMQPEVQSSWKALKALCWCDDDLARRIARQWLQRLLAVTLQQYLKNAILLPLPGVVQRSVTPAGHSGSTATSRTATAEALSADAATSTAVCAACDAWVEVLQQLVMHCPQGPNTLVDALQLHITSCKLQLSSDSCGTGLQTPAVVTAGTPAGTKATPAAAALGPSPSQQQKQRAAVARVCVQTWAFVCHWVMQARTATSHTTLTRLAGIAQSLACVPEVTDWLVNGGMAGTAAAAAGHGREGLPAAGRVSGCTGSAPEDANQLASPQSATAAADRDDDGAGRGVPPLEPSKEPSTLCAAECKDAAGAAEQVDALQAAEAVCWPQAFPLNRALLSQQMAQVLAGSSLALLLVKLLQCKQPSKAADRGFQGRPCSSSSSSSSSCHFTAGANSWSSTAGCGSAGTMSLQCPMLYPWSDDRQDLQLVMLLMLMSSCRDDAGNFADFGLEAVTQQVLSRCTDARACLLVSQFLLEHLMRHQQDVYWSSLRRLVATAQQQDDERMIDNPFLQVVALLEQQQQQQQEQQQQQQQQHPSSAAASPAQVTGSSGHGGQASSGISGGWTTTAV